MSAANPHDASAPGESVAAVCREAGLVRLLATADGDALAATGVLARALAASDTAFQASVRRCPRPDSQHGTEADATVTIGTTGGDVALAGYPASHAAYAAARDLAPAAADPVLALAGVLAAGATPGDDPTTLATDAKAAGVERRPGVGVPTEDLAEGLAHTTLAHTPDSGEVSAYRDALTERDLPTEAATDQEPARRVASLLAFDAVRSDGAPPRAATAVERALRPHVGGPFETVEGYADVLDATARRAPGTGVALALGHDARAAARTAWRDHAQAAHGAIRAADTSRYDGALAVVTRTGPPGTVARLVRDYRSPEPTVLVVGDGAVAAAGTDSVADPLRAAAGADSVVARGDEAYARTDTSDPAALVDAFLEVVR